MGPDESYAATSGSTSSTGPVQPPLSSTDTGEEQVALAIIHTTTCAQQALEASSDPKATVSAPPNDSADWPPILMDCMRTELVHRGPFKPFLCEKNLEELYPNLWIALRTDVTLPVTVASAERSFSKLKIIKNYLRSSMSQEHLSGLAIMSINHDIGEANIII